MLSRIERKYGQMQRWVDAVGSVADWPAAMVLSMFRTRPADGPGLVARWSRKLFPHVWIRPAMLGGFSVRLDPGNMSHFVIFEEVFMEGVYGLGAISFTPDAIVDCGAFEGYFTLLAASRFPGVPIVAFEPDHRNLAGLRANLGRNHLAIDVRPAAVSTKDGMAAFSGGGCGGRLGEDSPNAVTVPVTNLCRVISELASKRLLLKLDVEGEEATLLPALMAVLPKQCAIFFEWHQGRDEYQRAVSLLAANGFVTSLTRENVVDDRTVYIDAFAHRN
ncbi:MAG TPA: FkbM family methyltransferase [Vicinamibacterales bacterium]|jgi:FkbM family methyltransferase